MSQSQSDPSPPSDVSPAPPSWTLKAKLYLFITSLKPVNPGDPVLQGLPPGSYNPSENVHPSALAPINGAPQWKGGLTSAILVRYEDSPVGPYDELIMVADGFANPHEKGTSGRITNIYVSSRRSVWNGRKNWNIPKHLARFEFEKTGRMTSCFKAFLPNEDQPFFTAAMTDSYLPGIPLPSFLLGPFMRLVQPPLLAGLPSDIQIGTSDEWLSITPVYRGRWHLAYIQPDKDGHERYGDGLSYPQIQPFRIGAKFTGSIIFPSGQSVISKTD